jgi:hypothetical protein
LQFIAKNEQLSELFGFISVGNKFRWELQ